MTLTGCAVRLKSSAVKYFKSGFLSARLPKTDFSLNVAPISHKRHAATKSEAITIIKINQGSIILKCGAAKKPRRSIYFINLNYIFIVKLGCGVHFALLRLVAFFAEESKGCLFAVFNARLIEGVYVEERARVCGLEL